LILRVVLRAAAAAAAVATAVAASIVAAGFGLYALLEPYLGRPGAAAIVALILALVAAIVALVLTRKAKHKSKPAADQSLAERAIELARAKPMVAAAAAIAAGVIAWRNPALIGIVAGAILNRPPPSER
jgi:hypothetical protein